MRASPKQSWHCIRCWYSGPTEIARRSIAFSREKWDEIHYADGSTYGERTIKRAVAGVSEYYDPEVAEEPDFNDGADWNRRRWPETCSSRREERIIDERVSELGTKFRSQKKRIAEPEAELDHLGAR